VSTAALEETFGPDKKAGDERGRFAAIWTTVARWL